MRCGGGLRALTYLRLPFSHRVIERDCGQAVKVLEGISPKPLGRVDCCNQIVPIADLHIIIPGYNVGSYVEKCLDSVLRQITKYTYIATIVDDGSMDDTACKLEKYAGNPRIRVIHQKNGGAAKARNTALSSILGNYVMYLDADDYLMEGAIEKLMDKAYEFDADIVEGSHYRFSNTGYSVHRFHRDSADRHDFAKDLRVVPWAKVLRASIFEHIHFPEGYWYEDSIFAFCIYPVFKKAYTISDVVYAYRINDAGITRAALTDKKRVDQYWITDELFEWSIGHQITGENLCKRMLDHFAVAYTRCAAFGDEVTEAGFIYLRESYIKIFQETGSLKGKYRLMDVCIRKKDYGVYALISRNWDNIA